MPAEKKTFGLLGTLLIVFVALPLVRAGRTYLAAVLFVAVIFWGFHVVSERRRQRVLGAALMAPALLLTILHYLMEEERIVSVIWLLSNSLALVFLLWILVTRLLRVERVTTDVLSSAVSGYLLLGILWALVYALLFHLDPTSLGGIESHQGGQDPSEFFYFSFVTLTTLGYGDIAPTGSLARTAASVEAVVGQLYLAVMIARLVGLQIAAATARE
ncbi:MAG: potassium channel family protein [Planctomycetota bacterium]|jgi:hypothetical protein